MSDQRNEQIDLGGINVRAGRLRRLRPEVVDELVASMRDRGQLQPIAVTPRPDKGYWLLAGWHRLEAARRLKWPSINATVFEGLEVDAAELIEIDENLIRAELSPAERALHTARRKELYEASHPETKQGGAAANKTKGGMGGKLKSQNENLSSFVADVAAKTGKGRSTVARDVARGKNGAHILSDIVGTSLDQGDEIDALLDLSKDQQHDLIEHAKRGDKVSAKTRLKQVARDQREQRLGQGSWPIRASCTA